ncbi:ABC transporter permease [Anaerocolumna aminovalerica]|uniref:ABC transporter permease n=1 Tax=Anaerocolumna aminovalerica TaxID=1527 RepID=UPI000BE4390B|nr:ABC transporter permease [Anaerocolumna aminovalerica]
MFQIIRCELKKLKRLKILSVGIISIVLSHVISIMQQTAKSQDKIFFSNLLDMNIWNNVTIILPFTLTLIGGYIINKEQIEDTQKNILVVPIKWSRVIGAKMITMLIYSLFLALLNIIILICTSFILQCSGINRNTIIEAITSLVIMQVCTYIGVLPIILFFSKSRGKYIWGTLFSMIVGVIGVFISNGKLVNWHPITTGFSIISYRMGNDLYLNKVYSFVAIIIYIMLSGIIYIFYYKRNED